MWPTSPQTHPRCSPSWLSRHSRSSRASTRFSRPRVRKNSAARICALATRLRRRGRVDRASCATAFAFSSRDERSAADKRTTSSSRALEALGWRRTLEDAPLVALARLAPDDEAHAAHAARSRDAERQPTKPKGARNNRFSLSKLI